MALRQNAHNNSRCPSCRLSTQWCYCHKLNPVLISTPLHFILHFKELYLPSNTVNLIQLIAPDKTYIYPRGAPTFYKENIQQERSAKIEHRQEGARNLFRPDPTQQYLYLYPDQDAIFLDEYLMSHNCSFQDLNFIIPDGSWSQAKKIKRRTNELSNIKSVKVNPLKNPSHYFLRTQKDPLHFSTFEAVAMALKIIEGESIYQQLMLNFDIMMKAFRCANPSKSQRKAKPTN